MRNRVKSIKTKNKQQPLGRRHSTLLKSLYGTDTTPAPAMLAAHPEFAGEMAQSFPQLQQSIADWGCRWKAQSTCCTTAAKKEETENA